MLFNTSLISRVIILNVLLLVLGFGIYGLFHIHREQEHLIKNTEQSVRLLLNAIENAIFHAMRQGNSQAVQAILESVAQDEQIAAVRIFHPDGTILKSGSRLEIGSKVSASDYRIFADGSGMDLYRENGTDVLGIVKPIISDRRCFQCHGLGQQVVGVLNLNFSLDDTKESLVETTRSYVLSNMLMVAVLSVGISFILLRFVKRPISAISNKMARVEAGDLSVRMHPETMDEIGTLMQSFNSMVDNLEMAKSKLEQLHFQQMERADRLASVGEMATGLAHEIKNPLAGINGAITIIADEFPPENPVREIIGEIQNQIKRLDKTATDLLVFGRPGDPEFAPVDINELLKTTIFFVNQHREAKQINWIEELTRGLSPVWGDAKQIQQVLLNIMINAIQAMQGTGVLTIITDRAVVQDREMVRIAIGDTGPGIADEVREKIFVPFYTTKTQGTGLGLAICKRLIEQQGGLIYVDSGLGQGTVFTIDLPVYRFREPEIEGD